MAKNWPGENKPRNISSRGGNKHICKCVRQNDALEKCRLFKVAGACDIRVNSDRAGAHLPTDSEESVSGISGQGTKLWN